METFGGLEGDAVELLNDWAAWTGVRRHPPGEKSRHGRRATFIPYWSQVLSSTAQRAAAAEILNRVREEVATRNAMHAGRVSAWGALPDRSVSCL